MYLNNHTYYSLRYGTFNEQDLIELALENGVKTIVLTDINNTSACLNFIRLCAQHQLHGVLGIDFRNNHHQQYVGIAKNNDGLQELNTFLSYHLENKIPFPSEPPAFDNVYLIYPFDKVIELDKVRFRESEFIGISTTAVRKMPFTSYINMLDKMVVMQTVSFRSKKDYNAHRLLRCIDLNILLSQLPESQQGNVEQQMIPVSQLKKVFKEYPIILQNTTQLLSQCHVSFNFENAQLNANQQVYSTSKEADYAKLRS